jgi:hypothetical protein
MCARRDVMQCICARCVCIHRRQGMHLVCPVLKLVLAGPVGSPCCQGCCCYQQETYHLQQHFVCCVLSV